jgi:hypothetical protein
MGDVIDNPNLADVCPDCNGEQTVVELIPGHSPDCFTNGKCVDECPIPYEMVLLTISTVFRYGSEENL